MSNHGAQSRASVITERQIAEDSREINLSQVEKSAWDFLLIKAGMPRTKGATKMKMPRTIEKEVM